MRERGGIEFTPGLGREQGSGCLIDRSHLESIARSLAGQRRDTHNQHLLKLKQTTGIVEGVGVGCLNAIREACLDVVRIGFETRKNTLKNQFKTNLICLLSLSGETETFS